MGSLTQVNYLIFLLILSSFYFGIISVNDTITSTRFIRDPEAIISSNGDFKLGFFSPEKSTNRYVAIWYLSETYIIWIANRDQPLNDSSGVFQIHKDGNLVVMNPQNRIIWSTNVSIIATNTSAQLDDSGNLILRDVSDGKILWDSFTHPADVAVPSMKIAANRLTGEKIAYVSWKSSSDPSSGYFTGSLERLDAPEVFFWFNKTKPYWRTGPWNGRVFLGSPRMLTEYLYGWRFEPNDNGTAYLTYNFENPSMFGVLTITPHGTLKLVEFLNKKIFLELEVDQNKCDFYGTCGPYGSCDNSTLPICSCFEGFKPSNLDEWNRENWTSGCVRNMQLNCDKLNNGSDVQQDGFLEYHNMKVPDFAERSINGDQDKCRADCLANCSCLAYAYDSYIGCMFWSRDLIDLQKFPNGGVDLFIRVPAQLLVVAGGKKEKDYKGLIIGITLAIGALITAVTAYLLWRKFTPKHTDPLQRKILDWKKRFNIIEGIARGVLYLHRDSRLRIIHRDLKASNILLDDEMNPKISDFGLARIVRGGDDDEANTKRVVGTYGYMPPEYAMEGIFSEKSDVYSFGVLLLEIVSGRRNTSFYNNEQSLSLVGYAWKLWNEDNIMSIIDPEIHDPMFEKSILRCIHIGLLCVQELTKERPTISTVVLMLISEITHLPPPRQVAFVQKQNCQSSESSQKSQFNSNNDVTISEIQGR
ncbi:G-type lectin S-receptor-like serine/threonine-protein kinase At1g11330 isoform X3 [Glycine max]|uniref:Receptor-like serine/threonine-protein kinase n=1 Tax=Glycine max TaxID=3847 RepID=A0A0R0KG24_SOYBN|nr:G-type lectin S-receptor-like serine/threonine-protein kinase At1g11330 isoform X3 [Glycine max]|eukprot:XP_014629115.1 G-type lectin S-receptor-like serine/threonine-protein kinase At1g11330 isoform X3 [Glycine max]